MTSSNLQSFLLLHTLQQIVLVTEIITQKKGKTDEKRNINKASRS